MTTKKNKQLRSFDELAIEHFTKNPELADDFLEMSLTEYQKDGDEKALLIALRQVTMARGGFSVLAKETGLSRENLYKVLSVNGNPRFSTINTILSNLGYVLSFKHIGNSHV